MTHFRAASIPIIGPIAALAAGWLLALAGVACPRIVAAESAPVAGDSGKMSPPPRAAVAKAPGKTEAARPERNRESILDLRQYVTPAGAHCVVRTAAEIEVTVPLTPPVAFDFYYQALARDGWTIVAASKKSANGKVRAYFEKSGSTVSLSAVESESPGKCEIALRDRGELDTDSLPRPATSEVTSSSRPLTVFLAREPLAATADAISRLLVAAGWQAYRELDAPASRQGSRTLWFRQSRNRLTVTIVGPPEKGGKTRVSYSVCHAAHATPTPPGAADVELDDAKWQARCLIQGGAEAVIEFYRQEMPTLGFKASAASSGAADEKLLRFDGDDRSMVLVSLVSKGPTISVSLHGMSAEQLADKNAAERETTSDSTAAPVFARRLPLPNDNRHLKFSPGKQEITFNCEASVDKVISKLRHNLNATGWLEKSDASLITEGGGMTEFKKGDASLLIMLDQPRPEAETAVTITGKGLVWD